MAGPPGNCISRCSGPAGNSLAQATTLHLYRLVLVHRHARARDRLGGSRRAGARTTNPGIGYQALCAAIAATIIILLGWRAFVQTSYWGNSEVLWNHALDVTSDNDMAYYNLGHSCLKRGDFDDAISRFETALQIRSRNSAALYNSGTALIEN